MGLLGLGPPKGWFAAHRGRRKGPPEELYKTGVVEVLSSHLGFPVMMALIYTPWIAQGRSFGLPEAKSFWFTSSCSTASTRPSFTGPSSPPSKLFRLIHRKHHQWRHVRGISAEHAHIVETS